MLDTIQYMWAVWIAALPLLYITVRMVVIGYLQSKKFFYETQLANFSKLADWAKTKREEKYGHGENQARKEEGRPPRAN